MVDKLNITIPGLYILCAYQGSGKSHLIRYLMYENRKKFDYGIVFTNTFFDDDAYDFFPAKFVHPEYDENILQKLMDIQAKLIEKGIIKEVIVIFDDCIDDPNQFTSKALKRLCTQLRHYHITVIFSTQYCNAIPPRMRTNSMGCFIFKTDTEVSLKALFESYGQKFETYKQFKKYLMDATGDYKFVYYDKSKSGEIGDMYQVMKCPEKIPKFKLVFRNKI